MTRNKDTIWAWYCDKPFGGYLFHGNPKPDEKYHVGDLANLLVGEGLVWEYTKRELVEAGGKDIDEWNIAHEWFRVRPVRVTVAMERVQKAKGGAS